MEKDSFIINDLIEMHYDLVSGAPVFKDTRVPIQIFFDHMDSKTSIEEFIEDYPSVTKKQVEKLMSMITRPKLDKIQ